MLKLSLFALSLSVALACAHPAAKEPPAPTPAPEAAPPPAPAQATKLVYPAARRGEVVDDYHGVQVADPYRWLEDPDSEESRAWIAAQNKLTQSVLSKIPARERIRARLGELWNFEKFGVPTKRGGRYLYSYNSGLLNQDQLMVLDRLDGEPRLLLDPGTLSDDGTVALRERALSPDGRYLAYALSTAGSDWQTWRVRDVASGKDLDDKIEWSKFSEASWTQDSKGFFYSAYDAPSDASKALTESNYFQKLYYHRLGTAQSRDRLVYERTDQKEWGFGGEVSEDGRYLVIHVWKGTDPKNAIFYQDLKRTKPKTVELFKDFDALYAFVGNDGPRFYFRSDRDAPRGRLIAVDIRRPHKIEELVAESEQTLEDASYVGGYLIAQYLQDAKSAVKVFSRKGTFVRDVALPGMGSVSGTHQPTFRGSFKDPETFFSFTSFTSPTTIYRYDVKTGAATIFKQPKLAFDPAAYETRQIFYESKDGTRVPMFITHKKGLALDGQRPTFLYGYGGFNISLSPWFSVRTLVWMELGGVYAVANLRGGNEYGESWHQAGIKANKQNVFDDFIAAAEWLQSHDYTSNKKLVIGGGSNGGLLVGACLTQRPELYGAALPRVGVLDMLRYHKWTIGWAWASDYGTSDDPQDFAALYAYSPYHKVRPGTAYPPTLITTADHDDRVVPAHSFKFAAALQHAQKGTAPILIRIETKAGHGAGKPTDKIIAEAADRWAFALKAIGASVDLGKAGKAAASGSTEP